jgi:hypothetical protein
MKDIRYAPAWIGAIFRRLAEREDCAVDGFARLPSEECRAR